MFCSFYNKEKLVNILQVMIPILITQLALMGMNFFDTVMSGQAGAINLAGVAVGSNLWMPVFTGFNGILVALTPIVAHFLGEQKKENIAEAVVHGIYLAVFIGALVIIAGIFLVDPIFSSLGLEKEVYDVGKGYLGALAFGIIPFFVNTSLRSFVDTLGYTTMTMRIFLLTLPINVFFNYLLIFGKMGFPALGGVGAGYATSLTSWFIFFVFVFVIKKIDALNKYDIFSSVGKINFSYFKEQIAIGVPIGVSIFFEASIFGVVAFFVAKFGTNVIAAHQAAMNFSSILYMLPLSISMALTILVGVEVGAKRYDDAVSYAKTGLAFNWTVASIVILAFVFSRHTVASMYSEDKEIITLIEYFLYYALFFQFLDGTAAPIQGVLRGYKDVKVAFYSSLCAYWIIALPLGYYLDIVMQHGAFAYWQGLVSGIFFSAVFLLFRLRRIQEKFKSVS